METKSPTFLVSGFFLLACCGSGIGQSTPHSHPKHASKDPFASAHTIIQEKCAGCHNDQRHPENVNLSTYEKIMKSGEHGPIVAPGHPEKSNLIRYIDGEKQPRMPYKKPPLSKKEISAIRDWIKAGARP